MIKKLYTILLSALVAVPVLAQQPEGCPKKECVTFAPRKGQWQVSLVLGGSNSFYNENTGSYLLPGFTNTQGSIGLPNGGVGSDVSGNVSGGLYPNGDQSGELGTYLNIGGFNNNSLVNIVGLQAKYFFNDCWNINFTAGLNINVTPKKDYVEGDYESVEDMIIPAQKYVNAQTTNNWYVTVGTERYFKTSNRRILPYVGVLAGFQMARIETMEPYTGVMYDDPDTEEKVEQQVYLPAGKAGQMFGIKGALVAGIEYGLMDGLFLGLEIQPLAYRYDVIQIAPKGFDKYNVSHHNIKLIDMPVLKIGFRF